MSLGWFVTFCCLCPEICIFPFPYRQSKGYPTSTLTRQRDQDHKLQHVFDSRWLYLFYRSREQPGRVPGPNPFCNSESSTTQEFFFPLSPHSRAVADTTLSSPWRGGSGGAAAQWLFPVGFQWEQAECGTPGQTHRPFSSGVTTTTTTSAFQNACTVSLLLGYRIPMGKKKKPQQQQNT